MVLADVMHTLGCPKFAAPVDCFGIRVAAQVAPYTALASRAVPASVLRIIAKDADDDHVTSAAVTARAKLIVTGEGKHLLPIASHQGVAIVLRERSSSGARQWARPDPGARGQRLAVVAQLPD